MILQNITHIISFYASYIYPIFNYLIFNITSSVKEKNKEFICEAILPRYTVGSRQAEYKSQGSQWKRTI